MKKIVFCVLVLLIAASYSFIACDQTTNADRIRIAFPANEAPEPYFSKFIADNYGEFFVKWDGEYLTTDFTFPNCPNYPRDQFVLLMSGSDISGVKRIVD